MENERLSFSGRIKQKLENDTKKLELACDIKKDGSNDNKFFLIVDEQGQVSRVEEYIKHYFKLHKNPRSKKESKDDWLHFCPHIFTVSFCKRDAKAAENDFQNKERATLRVVSVLEYAWVRLFERFGDENHEKTIKAQKLKLLESLLKYTDDQITGLCDTDCSKISDSDIKVH